MVRRPAVSGDVSRALKRSLCSNNCAGLKPLDLTIGSFLDRPAKGYYECKGLSGWTLSLPFAKPKAGSDLKGEHLPESTSVPLLATVCAARARILPKHPRLEIRARTQFCSSR